MGYGGVELRVAGQLNETATERECEELAWWLDFAEAVRQMAQAGPLGDRIAFTGSPDPVVDRLAGAWTVEDWAGGYPCPYHGHQHDPSQAEKGRPA